MSFISTIRATVENDITWKLSQNLKRKKEKRKKKNACDS